MYVGVGIWVSLCCKAVGVNMCMGGCMWTWVGGCRDVSVVML